MSEKLCPFFRRQLQADKGASHLSLVSYLKVMCCQLQADKGAFPHPTFHYGCAKAALSSPQ